MSALEFAPQSAFPTWTFPNFHSTSMMSSPAARAQSVAICPPASRSMPRSTLTSPSSALASSTPSTTAKMDSSFSYELPMDWRPAQSFDYQPYPSPFPSPAPSYVSNRVHHGPPGPPTGPQQPNNQGPASPTLSSTVTSPHRGPAHAHSASHSHSASIDPSLQEPYAHNGWSQSQQQQQQQQPSNAQSPVIAHQPHPSSGYASPPSTAKPASNMTRQELEQELARMKTRVNELEVIHHWLELKGMRIEPESQRIPQSAAPPQHHAHHAHHHSHSANMSPTVQHHHHQHHAHTHHASSPSQTQSPVAMGGVAPTEDFAASWRVRTDARIKRFCALNRAGNALCAWHDSRRERRAYPPRQAPPGYLNCGCTNEEALFEESLARHGVGSYHPGEMVRMDPALRNPLLKLLQTRFGYVDGDFERESATGQWLEGEGPELWENILPSGKPPVSGGRKRGDTK